MFRDGLAHFTHVSTVELIEMKFTDDMCMNVHCRCRRAGKPDTVNAGTVLYSKL